MRKKPSKIFKPMTHEQLRKNDIVLLLVVIVGLFFLRRDFIFICEQRYTAFRVAGIYYRTYLCT